jgi:putative peptidoglycan lipid II flippase
MKKTIVIIMLITIASKISGFIREVVLANFFGVSYVSDAYLVSLTIPIAIFSLIGMGIVTSFIPIYNEIREKENNEIANNYINNLIINITILCTIIVIFVVIFAPIIVRIFASGFNGEVYDLAVTYTRIFIFSIYFYSISYVYMGYLQSNNKLLYSSISSIPLNLGLIIAIYVGAKYNIYLLAIGSMFATILQLVFLHIVAMKKGFHIKRCFNFKDKYLRRTILLALPVIFGMSVNQLNVLVDRTIASNILLGGISALNYSNRLNSFVQGIFVSSIATVMYPAISKISIEGKIEEYKKTLSESLNVINLLVVPVSFGTMVFSEQIITLIYGHGAFDSYAIKLTSEALFFYAIGMVGIGLREVLSRAFYSKQDTKTPMINSTIGIILNIILNIVLSRHMGINGLALATSIAAIITTGLMFISLHRKIGSFGFKQISITFQKVLLASLIMGANAKLSFNYLASTLSQNTSLLLSIAIGALSYFMIIYFMKIEDVDIIANAVKRKLRKPA